MADERKGSEGDAASGAGGGKEGEGGGGGGGGGGGEGKVSGDAWRSHAEEEFEHKIERRVELGRKTHKLDLADPKCVGVGGVRGWRAWVWVWVWVGGVRGQVRVGRCAGSVGVQVCRCMGV